MEGVINNYFRKLYPWLSSESIPQSQLPWQQLQELVSWWSFRGLAQLFFSFVNCSSTLLPVNVLVSSALLDFSVNQSHFFYSFWKFLAILICWKHTFWFCCPLNLFFYFFAISVRIGEGQAKQKSFYFMTSLVFIRSHFLSFSFFKICLFIYLFLAALGLRCCTRAFSSRGERGLLFVVVRGLLIAVASR